MKFIVVKFISPRKFLSPIEVNHHIFGNHTALVQGYQVVPHGELISKIPPFRPYIFFRRTRFQDFRAVPGYWSVGHTICALYKYIDIDVYKTKICSLDFVLPLRDFWPGQGTQVQH